MCNKDISVFRARFDEISELGKGRFGIVFLVEEKQTQVKYAAKFLKIRKRSYREQAVQEISILKILHHENIIKYIDTFIDRQSIIIVMEYVDGGELFMKISQDEYSLTEANCANFISQICHGVEYLHNMSVVHLDLKPENIICSSMNKIKIVDFGVAKKLQPEHEERVMCGTPEFLAPEIVNYESISTKTDMWSVGVICYILLSGYSPFLGDSDAETFNNITSGSFDFNVEEFETISENGKHFISSLLVKSKEKRLSANHCLAHPWLLHNIDTSETLINTENLRKYIARRRWLRCGQAIRAVYRMSGLLGRSQENLSTVESEPRRGNNLLEQRLHEEFKNHKRVNWKSRTGFNHK